MANDAFQEPPVSTLLTGIVKDAQDLTRQQFALLKQEVKAELSQAKRAAISLSIGAAILAVGLFFLLFTLVYVLHEVAGLRLWATFGIVGGSLALIGGALLAFGGREASDVHLMPPQQTTEAMKENVEFIREQAASRM
jgi:hypothetical protein